MSYDFVIGSPVRGKDEFRFREDFLEDLQDSLKKDNVLMMAPRRMGKTSVMYHLFDNPPKDTFVIHVNVESLESAGDFVIHLLESLHEADPQFSENVLIKGLSWAKSLITRVESFEFLEVKLAMRKDEEFKKNWEEKAQEFIQLLRKQNKKFLFIVDELPDMVLRIKKQSLPELETFLHWFRSVRIDSKNDKIRWLMGGSVNLRGTLDKIGLINVINDLKEEILPPFTPEETRAFIKEMLESKSIEWEPEIPDQILSLLGNPIPFFLQLLAQELYRYWRRNGKNKITMKDLEQVYQKSLMGEQARDKLQHFRSRIYTYYSPEEQEAAFFVLDQLAKSEKGIIRKRLYQEFYYQNRSSEGISEENRQRDFDHLFWLLQSDFYIEEDTEQKWVFSNQLLKDWWKRNRS